MATIQFHAATRMTALQTYEDDGTPGEIVLALENLSALADKQLATGEVKSLLDIGK